MNKIIKIHTSYKDEDKNTEPFLYNIFSDCFRVIYEAIPEEGRPKTPDYLVNKSTFIEVTELHDGSETSRSAQWGSIAHRLQRILTDEFKKSKSKGLYSIETPRVFKLRGQSKFFKVTKDIVNAIGNNQKNVISEGINFSIHQINKSGDDAAFVTSSGIGHINPAETTFQNIAPKLKTANKQLGYPYKKYNIKRKIILLVNKYIFADRISDVIEGLKLAYKELLDYENIHEIWFQQEYQKGKFKHDLIYSRDFLTKFEKEQIEPENKTHQQQFELWYWSLERDDNKKPKLFSALKKFFNKYKPEEIFKDSHKRGTMARLGIWLIDNKKIPKAIWLIKQFVDDPDPGPKLEFDREIKEGKDPIVILTVMGNLAWVAQALARASSKKDPANLIEAFNFTKKVLRDTKSLYIVQQWLVPLAEISARRWWIIEKYPKEYKEFRELLLDEQNGLIAKYGKYKPITKYLVVVLNHFKDLTTKEIQFILDNLSGEEDDIAPLLIYYAIFRSKHYKKGTKIGNIVTKIDPEILKYDPKDAISHLQNVIKGTENNDLITSLAWHFWKITKDSPDLFDDVKEWIDKLFQSPKKEIMIGQLNMIIEENIEKHSKESLIWMGELEEIAKKLPKNEPRAASRN